MNLKKFVFGIIMLLLLCGLLELLAWGASHILSKYDFVSYSPVDRLSGKHTDILKRLVKEEYDYLTFNKVTGWTVKPNGISQLYKANSAGIRADREYSPLPQKGRLRIAAFGDSFTHCDDVNNNETWESYLEQRNINIEVMNLGVPGYGLDQAYLRYKSEGEKYKPDIVLIGLMSEDINRHISVFRPFYFSATGIPLTKPRYYLSNDSLRLIPNPMQNLEDYRSLLQHSAEKLNEIGRNDDYYSYGYRSGGFDFLNTVRLTKMLYSEIRKKNFEAYERGGFYDAESNAFRITAALCRMFCADVRKSGAIPVVLFFPNKDEIEKILQNKGPDYKTLLQKLKAEGITCLDIGAAFSAGNIYYKADLLAKNHYTPLGNRLTASYLNSELPKLYLK